MNYLQRFFLFTICLCLSIQTHAFNSEAIVSQGIQAIKETPLTVIDDYEQKLIQAMADTSKSDEDIAALHLVLSKAYYSKILANEAAAHAKSGLALLETTKDTLLLNRLLIAASQGYELAGNTEISKPMAEQALAWARSENNILIEQEALVATGLSDLTIGAYDDALKSFNLAYRMSDEDPDLMAKGHIAYFIALVHEYMKNQGEAIRYYSQASEHYKAEKIIMNYSDALYGLARAYKFNNQAEKAMALFEESIAISKQLGDEQGQAYTYKELAGLYFAQNDLKQGHKSLVKALSFFAIADNPYMLAEVNYQLAEFAYAQEQLPHAKALSDIAISYALGDSRKPHFIRLAKLKSKILFDLGRFQEAYDFLEKSYDENIKYEQIRNQETFERLRAEFNFREQEEQYEQLNDENTQTNLRLEAQKQQQRVLVLTIILLVTITLGIVFLFIQSKRAQAKLAELANTDPLTQLANRRTAFNSLSTQIRLAKREEYDLSIALIDLDHFKKINDSLGHPVGDQVLKCFAHMARAQFRNTDVIARIGGEEFLFIFPFTSVEQAQDLIIEFSDNLRESKELINLIGGRLTCSVGIINAKRYDDEISAISFADKVMYRAKYIGRDAIVIEP